MMALEIILVVADLLFLLVIFWLTGGLLRAGEQLKHDNDRLDVLESAVNSMMQQPPGQRRREPSMWPGDDH